MKDDPFYAVDVAMQRLKVMEAELQGMKKMRQRMDAQGRKALDTLIGEAESKLAEIKRKVIQLERLSVASSS